MKKEPLMKKPSLSIHSVVCYGILSIFFMIGCSKFSPPNEIDGKWYFEGRLIDGSVTWSERNGLSASEGVDLWLDEKGGSYKRVTCEKGELRELLDDNYPGKFGTTIETRMHFRGGKKHGIEWERRGSKEIYRLWANGSEIPGDTIVSMASDAAQAAGLTMADVEEVKHWLTRERTEDSNPMRFWSSISN